MKLTEYFPNLGKEMDTKAQKALTAQVNMTREEMLYNTWFLSWQSCRVWKQY